MRTEQEIRFKILVTGDEVVDGDIPDTDGPVIAKRLTRLGARNLGTVVCRDDSDALVAEFAIAGAQGVDMILTSGGLGSASFDDVMVQAVCESTGRSPAVDTRLLAVVKQRMASGLNRRSDPGFLDAARAQATIPEGATWVAGVGTAAALVVSAAPGSTGPLFICFPGPTRELEAVIDEVLENEDVQRILAGAVPRQERTIRLFATDEAELRATLDLADRSLLDELKPITCFRDEGAELVMITRFPPSLADAYAELERLVLGRHAEAVFSRGPTIDEILAGLLADRKVALVDASNGQLAVRLGRLTRRRVSLVIDPTAASLIEAAGVHSRQVQLWGPGSEWVALDMATYGRTAYRADYAIGLVLPEGDQTAHISVVTGEGGRMYRSVRLPLGSRAAVSTLAGTYALHMLRQLIERERAIS
jgi:nicotinamide-nucleotide amidase